MRSFEFAIGLRVFRCGASKFYAQNFCDFLYICGGERGPFVRDDGCWQVRTFCHDINDHFRYSCLN